LNLPRVRIAQLPTPIESLPRLSAALSGPRIYVKRDDQTGLAFGGNKIRKLELVLAEAQAVGARTLVTTGSVQSNHYRQTAALAARFGLDCILVLYGSPTESISGNLLLDHLLGAEIVWTEFANRQQEFERVFQQAWDAGRRPYKIPLGASTPLGTVGYTVAFEEMLAQNFQPDAIVLASSSGGTQAGLALGARRANNPLRIIGISIDHKQADLQQVIANLATQASDLLGEKLNFSPAEILVNDEFLGGGYGVLGEPEVEAIRLFARTEGLLLDPVYTARAAAGMMALIRRGFFKPEEKVLFWHTGGTPALFAEKYSRELTP
jgi:D-cysteine desulfhydrase family pyridoxal phosphate-dependent enzyme